MKTSELFEQRPSFQDWAEHTKVHMMVDIKPGETFTEEYADYVIRHATEQAGGFYEKGPKYYYPSFGSQEDADQMMKILRRMSRGKPRFNVEIIDMNDEPERRGIMDWQIHLEEPTEQ